ncbi:hypothetical protein [Helcococcus kunzii]|mgnify:CR=1 FL=1|uniref:Uncharacterized protein n=1 Tax=Helcococcus kunzii ATCC 51366 TaxID=883114 RepID=H3NM78_9FIRM|nr:hypothetical protein HMPREF9709_00439 [Helcococcus kunzii ATCC 51366]
MCTNNNLNNTMFKLNYISSILFLIFTLAIRFYYAQTWGDKTFYKYGRAVGVFYISIILTIVSIYYTIRFYKKLKKADK